MTQIRRPLTAKQEQHRTLIRLSLFLTAVVVVALFLLELDTFAKRPNNRQHSSEIVSPDKLLAKDYFVRRKGEEKSLRKQSHGDASEEGEQEPHKQAAVQAQQRQEEVGDLDPTVPHRFEMKLANLVVGKDGGSASTTGTVILETVPSWAPIGAEHFVKLIQHHFYDECRFFRVLPNFVVQFGIAASPIVQQQWKKDVLQDDPKFVQSNDRGTITYATSGANTRTTQLFINKKDNKHLDKEGFTPFARVVEGMDFIDRINAEHREQPKQGRITQKGNAYLKESFPNLSYVVSIRPLPDQGGEGAAADQAQPQ